MTKTGDNGRSQADAKERLAHQNYNEFPEAKRSPLLEFFSHFQGPIVRHWADFIITVRQLANALAWFFGNDWIKLAAYRIFETGSPPAPAKA